MIITSFLRIILSRSLKPFLFEPLRDPKLYYEDLPRLGLYVHIPFCEKICGFCPYNKTVYQKDLADRYVKALLREIDIVCQDQIKKKNVTSLYFGGGSPALVVAHLATIIDKLQEYFDIQDGIGIELHPDNIDEYTLSKIKEAGINMISVGIQSFDKGCLEKLSRKGNDNQQKIILARSYGFDVIDVDLIFAIPSQTTDSLLSDVQTAFDCGATQVSTYPFIEFSYTKNKNKPLGPLQKKRMLKALLEKSQSMGLERTSVWTFARKNTSKYSSVTRENFLGFGASATSLLRRQFKINTFKVGEYIKAADASEIPTSLTLTFTPRQRYLYWMFWSAYGLFIDTYSFEELFGCKIHEEFAVELKLAELLGFIQKCDGGFRVTSRASFLYHIVEQEYTHQYIDKIWKCSREAAFPKRILLW